MRPPAAKKSRMTSAQAARAVRSFPTLKVIQLPRPTTGSASPVDGIGRLSGDAVGVGPRALAAAGSQAPLPMASIDWSSWRRCNEGE